MMPKPWRKTETDDDHLLPDMLHSMGGSKSKISGEQCYEGAQTRQGSFWYVCRQGREVPISCVAPDGRTQFAIGQTFKTPNFLLQCSQPTPNGIQMAPVACITPAGQIVYPGNMFTPDQTFYFRCIQSENSLQTQLAGCVGPSQELVPDGGLLRRGQFLYKCQFTHNGIKLEAFACIFDNRQYYPDQDILTPAVWYRCETDGNGGIAIKLKGCIKQGQRQEVGKRFNDGVFAYICKLEDSRIYPQPVGCVERFYNGTMAEYDLGQKWLSEVTSFDYNRYVFECQKDGSWLRKNAVQCYYNTPEGAGYLRGGCMRKVGQRLVQCHGPTQQSPNVRMRIQEPYNDHSQLGGSLTAEGLAFC
uniref:Abnormal cell migration protein 18-like fibronectin type I domain-containing protein n=1 Tax=Romanomermis culicivorax TaxID=13658 RepID=A0A915J2R9_ROMCU